MEYLSAEEYQSFGLSPSTPQNLVASASALIDAYCRRNTLAVEQYTERVRISRSGTARLSYLPLLAVAPAASAIISARARYASLDDLDLGVHELYSEACAFGMPGTWVDLDIFTLEVSVTTGEIVAQTGLFPLRYSELEITYTAGMETPTNAVKHACALIVRNALATPSLNVRASSIDRMHLEYFSDSLLDADVRRLLAPYVAQKVG